MKRAPWLLGLAFLLVPAGVLQARSRKVEPAASFVEETTRIPLLGNVPVYRPDPVSRSRGLILFISGDGGWKLGVVPMAQRLAGKALVVGIPMTSWREQTEKHAESCWYPAGELEAMAQAVEKVYKFPHYLPPILVGYSSGATVVYGALAQAPAGTFAGGVSLGFCPDLGVKRPICSRGSWKPSYDPKKKISLLPDHAELKPGLGGAPSWIALQGQVDQVCSPQEVDQFVATVPSAKVVRLPKVGHGFGVLKNWGEAFDRAVATYLEPETAWSPPRRTEPPSAPNLAPDEIRKRLASLDLPLVVSWPRDAGDVLIFVSGDGGWMELDREVASRLHTAGVAVVGWSTLRYFWEAKKPAEFSADLGRVVEALPDPLRVFAGGYSFGAEVVPVCLAADRSGGGSLARLVGLILVGPGPYADFEVSPLDWIFTNSTPTRFPVATALEKERQRPILCIESSASGPSGCPKGKQPNLHRVRLPGSHHFGGDYATLAAKIVEFIGKVERKSKGEKRF